MFNWFHRSLNQGSVAALQIYFHFGYVYNLTPVHIHDHAANILQRIQDVFEDIEVHYDHILVNYNIDTFVDLQYGEKYLSKDSDIARGAYSGSTSSLSGIHGISSNWSFY